MDDRSVRIHKTNLRANLNAVFQVHDDSFRQAFAGSGQTVRQPTNWADAAADQGMLERELGALPDEMSLAALVQKVGELLQSCKSPAWQSCPAETLAKYIAS